MKHSPNFALSSGSEPAIFAGSAAGSAASGGRLGKVVKSAVVDASAASYKRLLRRDNHALKNVSGFLVSAHDATLGGRISACCQTAFGPVSLNVDVHADGKRSASFHGVVTCRSGWGCPLCAYRLARQDQQDLNSALSFWRGEGREVSLLTLTSRHKRSDSLVSMRKGMKGALRGLRASHAYRSLGNVKSVTATEITDGANGWHLHFHILIVNEAGKPSILSDLDGLRPVWLRLLNKHGLSGNYAALDVRDGSAAGSYVAKFGVAAELALSAEKSARESTSRTPFEILAAAADGCKKSAARFVEYVLAMKGSSRLHWSRGLKAASVSDDLPDDGEIENPVVERFAARVWASGGTWSAASRRACSMLDAAELSTCLDAAEFGASDFERWRFDRGGFVIE